MISTLLVLCVDSSMLRGPQSTCMAAFPITPKFSHLWFIIHILFFKKILSLHSDKFWIPSFQAFQKVGKHSSQMKLLLKKRHDKHSAVVEIPCSHNKMKNWSFLHLQDICFFSILHTWTSALSLRVLVNANFPAQFYFPSENFKDVTFWCMHSAGHQYPSSQ